jgi:pteridine reductase
MLHEFCESNPATRLFDHASNMPGNTFAVRDAVSIRLGQLVFVFVQYLHQGDLFPTMPTMYFAGPAIAMAWRIYSANNWIRDCMPNKPPPVAAMKCALVTGAARRIGAVIATRLHEAGANVAIHFRGSGEEAIELRDRLNSARQNSAEVFQADLNDHQQLETLVQAVESWSGGIDTLINNASSFYATPLGSITLEQWDDLIGSNLKVPLFLSQAAMPMLKKAGGCIVNIVDIHAQRPLRDYPVYGTAKAGLAMLTRSLAKDMAPEVRVNGVAPGAIMWPEDGMSGSSKDQILRQIPLGHQGQPDDIADAVLYLVRDAAYVTGQIIVVDGGRSLGW